MSNSSPHDELIQNLPDTPTGDWKAVLMEQLRLQCGPAKEQQDTAHYRDLDLKYKKEGLDALRFCKWRVAVVSMWVSIFGFIGVGVGLAFSGFSLRNNVQQNMIKLTMDLDRVFIDKPGLIQFFEGGIDIGLDDPRYPQVYATAIMMLDVLDIAGTQSSFFARLWSTPEAWQEWEADEFAESPVLRRIYLARQDWYGKDMKKYYDEGKKRAAKPKGGPNFRTKITAIPPE